ncbi:acyltransferase [Pseudomonas resinovorans]|uniref:Acyltransferase n=1 Tax=Metapseudomonas resinovorans TaxID=53412 RepID=A0ABT4Y3N5_METRE|nr:acyltransferase [Pseudomonas resinovorans]MDA8483449.1 acyltransferase [Pseudomonas resinovorans]
MQDAVILEGARDYKDARGNRIHCPTPLPGVKVMFRGSNNRVVIDPASRVNRLSLEFNCSEGYFELGRNDWDNAFKGLVRIGQGSRVVIGHNVTCTAHCFIDASEMASVVIGEDCMFASGNQLRTDDAHPIFDVHTGKRINIARDILIGNHVWLGYNAKVLGGADIGEGTVIGMDSLVKSRLPNNCIAAGVPARLVRRDIAWERPHLSFDEPYFKPDVDSIVRSNYWNETQD